MNTPKIGPPVSGFKRSGALLFQVSQLNQLSPDYDYIILLEYDRVYVSFSHPPIRAAFCACRNKAMTTGDRRAVGMLAHFFLLMYYHDPRLQELGVKPGAMLGQMLTEFEFPDILRAANEMEQRMYLDEGQRPPLILDGGVSAAEWNAIPSTWLDVGIVPSPRV
ncbi:hypothetical protein FB45DRAFT_1058178 [Roridomyces roridus]|uniref:Uncharacterized protein n=1 Tax=Roridomyces roridus TaxID=1738132 RepID=A0AAD7FQK0_9AGAR|nr:hypothetical protein FB45DRAFT_1058178 [Roridomyces roridus]